MIKKIKRTSKNKDNINNKKDRKNIRNKKSKNNKKNINLIINLLLFIFLILLLLLIIDKLTLNKINTYISNQINNNLINKNPDSLIITIYSNKDQIAYIPLITYNEIIIDWGDETIENYKTYKLDDEIILPIHKYNKKGKYNIIITGDTKRGLFGHTPFTINDKYGKNMLNKEFFNSIPEYKKQENKGKKKNSNNTNNDILYFTILDKYIDLNKKYKEDIEKDSELQIYNILAFKNLNFKGLGNLTAYFNGEINNSWIEEFKNIEVFIETFSFSDITYIPNEIFKNSPNLRILSSTFLACNKLKNIPDDLILNLEKIENVRYCFSNCINSEGKAPNWWTSIMKFNKININNINNIENLPYILCFNECTKLENYEDIPFFWGGIIYNKENI